jgi:hypothetical protein
MSHWNYRLFEEQDGDFSIREVHYDDDGEVTSIGGDPAMPVGSSERELFRNLNFMLDCLDEPAMKEGNFSPDNGNDLDFTFIMEDNENKRYH